MSGYQVTPGFDRSWFDLDNQNKAVDQEQFLAGIEILTNSPHLAQTQYPLIEHAFQQLSAAGLKNWPQVERVSQVVQ